MHTTEDTLERVLELFGIDKFNEILSFSQANNIDVLTISICPYCHSIVDKWSGKGWIAFMEHSCYAKNCKNNDYYLSILQILNKHGHGGTNRQPYTGYWN